ncbi:MAG: hypothetical protein HY898_07245 [Deltaproteobacteria bacterium]|nr:hypothetical protein [Deltaproteobacteria bacterium]
MDFYLAVCVEGRLLQCTDPQVTTTYCEECGCPDGFYCKAADCHAQADIGAKCTESIECKTDNCGVPKSAAAGSQSVCLVAFGAACNDSNCAICMGNGGFCGGPCDPKAGDRCGKYHTSDQYKVKFEIECLQESSTGKSYCAAVGDDCSVCAQWPDAHCGTFDNSTHPSNYCYW